MSDRSLTPLFASQGQQTTAERLHRYAQLQALERLCKDEQARIRETLSEEADTIESVTGGAYNVKVPAVGQVYRTAPEPEPVVSNVEAFADWCDSEDLMGCHSEVLRLRILDEHTLAEAIQRLDIDDPDPEVLYAIKDSTLVHEETRVTDGVLDHLVRNGLVQQMVDGTLVTTDGEPVPGTDVKRGRRQLTVRITDKERFTSELLSMLPGLPERSEA